MASWSAREFHLAVQAKTSSGSERWSLCADTCWTWSGACSLRNSFCTIVHSPEQSSSGMSSGLRIMRCRPLAAKELSVQIVAGQAKSAACSIAARTALNSAVSLFCLIPTRAPLEMHRSWVAETTAHAPSARVEPFAQQLPSVKRSTCGWEVPEIGSLQRNSSCWTSSTCTRFQSSHLLGTSRNVKEVGRVGNSVTRSANWVLRSCTKGHSIHRCHKESSPAQKSHEPLVVRSKRLWAFLSTKDPSLIGCSKIWWWKGKAACAFRNTVRLIPFKSAKSFLEISSRASRCIQASSASWTSKASEMSKKECFKPSWSKKPGASILHPNWVPTSMSLPKGPLVVEPSYLDIKATHKSSSPGCLVNIRLNVVRTVWTWKKPGSHFMGHKRPSFNPGLAPALAALRHFMAMVRKEAMCCHPRGVFEQA